MRIWCLSVKDLDDQRLLGERRELAWMISIILKAERSGGFSAGGWHRISKYYRDRFKFVEKRYFQQIKEMRYRGFNPKQILNFQEVYRELPQLENTSDKSGWTAGGIWYRSTNRAKVDMASRWDSGVSRAGGINKPRWTKRKPPKWYKPKAYLQEEDIRFNPTYRTSNMIQKLAAYLRTEAKKKIE